jgi:DNA repair ATPase RecN
VTKKDGVSRAKILTKEEQIREIARIIGGESFQEESIQFAQKLLNN